MRKITLCFRKGVGHEAVFMHEVSELRALVKPRLIEHSIMPPSLSRVKTNDLTVSLDCTVGIMLIGK